MVQYLENQKCHHCRHRHLQAPSSEISDEEKARIKAEKDAIRRKRKGRRSTILTGPLGVQEDKKLR